MECTILHNEHIQHSSIMLTFSTKFTSSSGFPPYCDCGRFGLFCCEASTRDARYMLPYSSSVYCTASSSSCQSV